jgi:hypothetical protein
VQDAFAGLRFQKTRFFTGKQVDYSDEYEIVLYIVTDDYLPGESFERYSIRFPMQPDDE